MNKSPNSPLHLVNKSEAVNWKTNEDKQFPPKLTQINREFDFPQVRSLSKPEYYGSNYPSCNKASNRSKIAFIIPYRNRPVQPRVFSEAYDTVVFEAAVTIQNLRDRPFLTGDHF